MDLKDKVVVITGASKGLGKSLAEIFIKEGSQVTLSARSEKELEKASLEIGGTPFVADVTDEESVQSLADFVIEKFGRIDLWINNAGIWLPHGPIEEIDTKRFHDMIEVNLFGTFYGSRAALIQMRKKGVGTIINILSTSALEGRAGSAGYCASKYAAVGFTKSLRKEVEETDIKVISIYPGGMKTSLFNEKRPENYDEYMDADFVAQKTITNLKSKKPEEELIIRRT